jgi:acyl-CoA dehydrogenase
MLTLGGALKKKEMLSARLGDMLSNLYLASMVLKHYENQGRREADLPLVEWACRFLLYRAQEQLHGFLRNFPVRGRRLAAPPHRLPARPHLQRAARQPLPPHRRGRHQPRRDARPAVRRRVPHRRARQPLGLLQEAMELSIEVAPLEKRLRKGAKDGVVHALDSPASSQRAWPPASSPPRRRKSARRRREDHGLIHVDDFAPEELKPLVQPARPARKARGTRRPREGSEATATEAAEA